MVSAKAGQPDEDPPPVLQGTRPLQWHKELPLSLSQGFGENSCRDDIEMHSEKRRATMDIRDIGREAFIHWNGPPLACADSLGEAAIDRIFGRGRF